MINKIIFFSFVFTSLVFSNELLKIENKISYFKPSLEFLKTKPRSYAKDFYINQFLQTNITSKDALSAIGMSKNVTNKLFINFAKKFKHDETLGVAQCLRMSNKNLVKSYSTCIKIGLSIFDITKLGSNNAQIIYKKVKNKYPNFAKQIKIISSPMPFAKLISSSTKNFYDLYFGVGFKYRTKYFNYKIPNKTLIKISKSQKNFNEFIKYSITNIKLTNIHKSLLDINDINLDHLSSFLLALNAIKHDKLNKASKYLDNALLKAYYRMDKDKVLFWQYLLNKNETLLKKLALSWDNNIYSLYAKELTNTKINNIDYFIRLEEPQYILYEFDTKNQFSWIKVLNNIKTISQKKMEFYKSAFITNETVGHLAFILEKYYSYRRSYFITPFEEYLKQYDNKRKTLVYAIARQESRFIPSSISTSFAQGAMQIMPFLSKHIAKQLNEPYDIYQQFDIKTNLRYANYHLNDLEKKLKHPLFLAYAYNGGSGYLNSQLKNGLFKNKSKYEPFLSMELISYNETRKYGKKVLANYYIYYNYFEKDEENKITLQFLFDNVVNQIK